jgi:hypothetical protein
VTAIEQFRKLANESMRSGRPTWIIWLVAHGIGVSNSNDHGLSRWSLMVANLRDRDANDNEKRDRSS